MVYEPGFVLWHIMGSSNAVTFSSGHCWESTSMGFNSGSGIIVICPTCLGFPASPPLACPWPWHRALDMTKATTAMPITTRIMMTITRTMTIIMIVVLLVVVVVVEEEEVAVVVVVVVVVVVAAVAVAAAEVVVVGVVEVVVVVLITIIVPLLGLDLHRGTEHNRHRSLRSRWKLQMSPWKPRAKLETSG